MEKLRNRIFLKIFRIRLAVGIFAISMLVSSMAFAKCKGRGGKIAPSFCVKLAINEVRSSRSWLEKLLGNGEDYGCPTFAIATIRSIQVPRSDFQFAGSESFLKAGDEIKVGLPADYKGLLQINGELTGLIEERCFDVGEPRFSFVLNPSMSATALEGTGTVRSSKIDINCSL